MEQPSYYSITPAEVRYDNDLKANEKLLYGEITALSNKYGFCTASNGYFADLYGVTKQTVSTWISHLSKKKYVSVEIIRNENKTVNQRRIYISPERGGIKKNLNRYKEKDEDPIKKNLKENITSNNNTSINITSLSSSSYSPSNNYPVDNSDNQDEEEKNKVIQNFRNISKINDFGNRVTLPTTAEWRNVVSLSNSLSVSELEAISAAFEEQMKVGMIEQPFRYLLKMLRNSQGGKR